MVNRSHINSQTIRNQYIEPQSNFIFNFQIWTENEKKSEKRTLCDVKKSIKSNDRTTVHRKNIQCLPLCFKLGNGQRCFNNMKTNKIVCSEKLEQKIKNAHTHKIISSVYRGPHIKLVTSLEVRILNFFEIQWLFFKFSPFYANQLC